MRSGLVETLPPVVIPTPSLGTIRMQRTLNRPPATSWTNILIHDGMIFTIGFGILEDGGAT